MYVKFYKTCLHILFSTSVYVTTRRGLQHPGGIVLASCALLKKPDECSQGQPAKTAAMFWGTRCTGLILINILLQEPHTDHGNSPGSWSITCALTKDPFCISSCAWDEWMAHMRLEWRYRVTLNQASVSLNADAIMTAVRDFMERSARETSAKEEASGRRVSSQMPHMQTCGL